MASIYAFWWKTIQTIIVQDNLLVINLYFIPSLFFFPFPLFFFFSFFDLTHGMFKLHDWELNWG